MKNILNKIMQIYHNHKVRSRALNFQIIKSSRINNEKYLSEINNAKNN